FGDSPARCRQQRRGNPVLLFERGSGRWRADGFAQPFNDGPGVKLPAKCKRRCQQQYKEKQECLFHTGDLLKDTLLPLPGRIPKLLYQPAWSSTPASGAFSFTDLMPFSLLLSLSYISLVPIICPLAAFKLK